MTQYPEPNDEVEPKILWDLLFASIDHEWPSIENWMNEVGHWVLMNDDLEERVKKELKKLERR